MCEARGAGKPFRCGHQLLRRLRGAHTTWTVQDIYQARQRVDMCCTLCARRTVALGSRLSGRSFICRKGLFLRLPGVLSQWPTQHLSLCAVLDILLRSKTTSLCGLHPLAMVGRGGSQPWRGINFPSPL